MRVYKPVYERDHQWHVHAAWGEPGEAGSIMFTVAKPTPRQLRQFKRTSRKIRDWKK